MSDAATQDILRKVALARQDEASMRAIVRAEDEKHERAMSRSAHT